MQDIEKIYEEYFETVNKYLFCLTHNSDISEELTQETFCKAVKKINTYKGECKMSVWLCQIANIFGMINVEKIRLYKKMQKLDAQTREVMYLRITGELSFKEIGIILNKTENWARVTFYRGKNQLKEVD